MTCAAKQSKPPRLARLSGRQYWVRLLNHGPGPQVQEHILFSPVPQLTGYSGTHSQLPVPILQYILLADHGDDHLFHGDESDNPGVEIGRHGVPELQCRQQIFEHLPQPVGEDFEAVEGNVGVVLSPLLKGALGEVVDRFSGQVVAEVPRFVGGFSVGEDDAKHEAVLLLDNMCHPSCVPSTHLLEKSKVVARRKQLPTVEVAPERGKNDMKKE